ncbi:vitamin B12-dependent ribonucleotide reductase [Acidimicrobiia bacterium]|nr:vitamin B12-dependent ribonucleotide reductase [Acidimicrobiia bacterium]MDC0595333.1 vitamin B12-dependent ribonucleotide reductase [Acidimicrobiia bacterium]
MAKSSGLKVTRKYTSKGDPYNGIVWEKRTSKIANPDGSVVFEMENVEIPSTWSQVATDIMVSKYFRKAGVPQVDDEGNTLKDENGDTILGSETSSRQVFDRLAETWRHWGETTGYFATKDDAQAFEDELKYMLATQMAAPNSPQWFNTGLNHKYDLTGPKQGFWYVDPKSGELVEADDSYSRPQPHACFIQSIDDDLVNEGGIMDLWVKEARLFKFGSGTGTNFSNLRGEGEKLSGGGVSSGVMSFLKIGDRAAGAIKSGGTTRRAAKMVILDLDHPDIETFIEWKAIEEDKARALIAAGYPADFNGEAYATVSGQNSNNSVKVPTEFLTAIEEDGDWDLIARTDGSVMRTVKARELWKKVADAAWRCADPGVQYDTTINEWHTSPMGGRIRASNPCSEYLFLDNTACNLASLNLVKFYDDDKQEFDVVSYKHALRVWTIVLEISVEMAQFPSKEIAQGSYDYRTLGLGYANLGSLLMRKGIAYDSKLGRAIAGALTAMLTGEAYKTSAEMAGIVGTFPRYKENADNMLRVMNNHKKAAYDSNDYEGLSHDLIAIDQELCPEDLLAGAQQSWDEAVELGTKNGYRNAQATVLAPTGTIGLLMDCDTTGVEPDFALMKFKKLAGGGYMKIANQSIGPALDALGYEANEVTEIIDYVIGSMSLENSPYVNKQSLIEKGLNEDDVLKIEAALPGAFEIQHAFNVFVLGEETLKGLGIPEEEYTSFDFNLLETLGYSRNEIAQANLDICGTQKIEGAPYLKEEHLDVFDCANKCGKDGERFIHYMGHVRMMAAAQPFISGAISKTVNMPNEATIEDIEDCYFEAAKIGVKAIAIYRDGSKASQPLSSSSDDGDSEESDPEVTKILEEEAMLIQGNFAPGTSPSRAYAGVNRPRFLLPERREGWTQEARIAGHKVYLRTGEYPDGTLGEVFIDIAKEGATLKGVLGCFAIAVSKGLQYGVPLEEFVDTFTFQTFEPRGMVEGHENIKMSNSIIDYVFRALGLEYLDRTDIVQVPPKQKAIQENAPVAKAETAPVAKAETAPVAKAETAPVAKAENSVATVQEVLGDMMGDAPACNECGHITIRNGSCYKCLNCGNSLGCS